MTTTITGKKMPEIKLSYIRKRTISELTKLTTSKIVYDTFLSIWDRKVINLYEEFKVIYLDYSNHPLGIYAHSTGGVTGTVVDVKMIIGVALKCCAQALVVAHNHPSGNTQPSTADITITKKIREAAAFFNLNLVDALIITEEQYYSFSDNGLL